MQPEESTGKLSVDIKTTASPLSKSLPCHWMTIPTDLNWLQLHSHFLEGHFDSKFDFVARLKWDIRPWKRHSQLLLAGVVKQAHSALRNYQLITAFVSPVPLNQTFLCTFISLCDITVPLFAGFGLKNTLKRQSKHVNKLEAGMTGNRLTTSHVTLPITHILDVVRTRQWRHMWRYRRHTWRYRRTISWRRSVRHWRRKLRRQTAIITTEV